MNLDATIAMHCRMCGAATARRAFDVREMMFGWRERFTYSECTDCGGLQIVNIPADLSRFYPSDYYSLSTVEHLDTRKRRIANYLRYVQRAAQYSGRSVLASLLRARLGTLSTLEELRDVDVDPGARILDVGCGAGALLLNMRENGFRHLTGVDPFIPEALTYFGDLHIQRLQLNEVSGLFDLIMLHHVFEHVPDPVQTLRECRALLAPSGQVLLRFPSVPCAAFDMYGADWVQIDAPRHLQIISRAGLDAMAQRAGLKTVQWTQDSMPFQFWASEQYQQDIPLFDPRSYVKDKTVLSNTKVEALRDRAKALNREGRGDQSVAVLRSTDA